MHTNDAHHADQLRIAVIIGSTRPGSAGDVVGIERKGKPVGHWVHGLASARSDATFDIVDLADVELPLFDEPWTPIIGNYTHPHTHAWAATISRYDGFVLVTPEYNSAPPAALKNAIDFLYAEWANTAAGFVSYGVVGGVRAVEQLRSILGELQVADVSAQVMLDLYRDFIDLQDFAPADHQEAAVHAMLDQLVAWAGALRPLRARQELVTAS